MAESKNLKKEMENKYQKEITEIEKTLAKKQDIKIEKKTQEEKKLSIHRPNLLSNIIGLICLISGLVLIINPTNLSYFSILNLLLTNPNGLNIKLGLGLILIGLIFIVIIYEKKPEKLDNSNKTLNSKKIKLLLSEKITLVLTVWIIILFFITGEGNLEIFFTLIFLGLLVVDILLADLFTKPLRFRMYLFISVFLIIYIVIISQKIINILNI